MEKDILFNGRFSPFQMKMIARAQFERIVLLAKVCLQVQDGAIEQSPWVSPNFFPLPTFSLDFSISCLAVSSRWVQKWVSSVVQSSLYPG